MKKVLLIFSVLLFFSCNDATDNNEYSQELKLSSFYFLKKDNLALCEDVNCIIVNDSIFAYIPCLNNTDSLVASFTGNYRSVKVGGGISEVRSIL